MQEQEVKIERVELQAITDPGTENICDGCA